MNKTKRLLALLLVLALLLSLAACGSEKKDEPAATPEPTPEVVFEADSPTANTGAQHDSTEGPGSELS